MEYPAYLLLLSCLLPFIYSLISRRNSRLPPGPSGFPIIGNLLELGVQPHQSLAILSKRFGPFMSLKLGRKTTIVISSPAMAKEFFQTHDASFSSRTIPNALRADDVDKHAIIFLPAGDQWRKLRRIGKEYMFSMQQMNAGELLRRKKVQELLDHVNQCCTSGKALNISGIAFTTFLNILSNFMFSMDLAQHGSESAQEFKDLVRVSIDTGGNLSLSDFFPIVKWLEPLGLLIPSNEKQKKLLSVFDNIINERLQSRSTSYDGFTKTDNDVLDLLLNLHHKGETSVTPFEMRYIFLSLYIAGTDTTSSTLEWGVTELIRNPEKMEMARSELIKFMQNIERNIQEDDISQLPYLQAVIKETLRLHPPVPFLVPHQAVHDVEIQGFIVPKDAQILCNVWAMGRDQNIWSEPELFMPERFIGKMTDYKGQHFELIPFGAGRRICPGLNLAHRTLHIMLGSLIHKFDWRVVGCVRPQDIDMEEHPAITVQKKVPLMAIPTKL